ncbi:squalene synthetase-like protein [Maudiozyma exigua]|uniref:Protein SQS1 n=1 Tax=Maudiozyma exigua TaxID=34358 RepID=A0A9P6WCE2_MAUEX|nr:squalene synthetase-like protein [Kazachstania exigua]
MAKRHKHYTSSKKKKGGNSSNGSRGKHNQKSKNNSHKLHGKNASHMNDSLNNWYNSSVPMGNGDLEHGMEYPNNGYYNRGRAIISAKSVEDYYFGRKKNKSMKSGGFRSGRRAYSSTDLSSSNGSFRKRPMVFVKASEVYDPSHDLILQLQKKTTLNEYEKTKNEETQNENKDSYEYFDSGDESEEMLYESSNEESDNNKSSNEEMIEIEEQEHEPSTNDDVEEFIVSDVAEGNENVVQDNIAELGDDELFFVDDMGYSNDKQPKIKHVIDRTEAKPKVKSNLEFDSSLVIGKVEIPLEQTENGDVVANLSHAPYRNYIKNVLKDMHAESDTDEEEEYEDFQQEFDEDDLSDISIPDIAESDDSNDIQLSEDMKSLELNSTEKGPQQPGEPGEPQEPEFGFLEEDYVINTSDIYVSNIRLGLNDNAYFLKCYQLFGDLEARWIDQEIFTDFLLQDLGLPEARLNAYLKHVKDVLIPKEESPEPTYSDIPFSDTDDEEKEIDAVIDSDEDDITLMEDMDEGLDDLVHYAMKYNKTRNQEFDTKTPVMSGKGKKKKLLIDESLGLETETIYSLQDKFSTRLNRKADKRKNKEDFIMEENKNSFDLTKKYPYGLHILNIRDEFDEFYSNNRDRLIFPPLDPHANKTLMKFAKHYNMKPSKAGKGIHTHTMIEKTRKTKRSMPNYGLIAQLVRQRPVFMRIDVKRVQEDFVKTERIKIKSKFNVTEGEIVGEDAPEIGSDNIGRRMLEKLGWSSGEGLGAVTNKGINKPLFARVKKGKAGLRLSEEKKK